MATDRRDGRDESDAAVAELPVAVGVCGTCAVCVMKMAESRAWELGTEGGERGQCSAGHRHRCRPRVTTGAGPCRVARHTDLRCVLACRTLAQRTVNPAWLSVCMGHRTKAGQKRSAQLTPTPHSPPHVALTSLRSSSSHRHCPSSPLLLRSPASFPFSLPLPSTPSPHLPPFLPPPFPPTLPPSPPPLHPPLSSLC